MLSPLALTHGGESGNITKRTEYEETGHGDMLSPRAIYSKVRNIRSQATFNLMMKMAPSALASVRQEFHVRNDRVTLEEFIYIMSKHLIIQNSRNECTITISHEQLEFASSMNEIFKEVDMNGDGYLEWEEFTKLTVEKASTLNKRYAVNGIPNYYDSSSELDSSAHYRHRHDISHICPLPKMGAFALTEDHKNAIWIINARTGTLMTTIRTDAVPLALENIPEKDLLLATCADMTMITILLDDPMPSKKFSISSAWPTSGAQMSLAWMPSSKLLYSGSTNGVIYAWDLRKKTISATLRGHTDIVMSLLGLKKLDNLVSASLDSTIGVWDTYTNSMILKLEGHRKGVFSLSYNPDARLLISCGFDHDAFVWSPFVNSLVFRLKGHHASLVGCQCVENSSEVITADAFGVFKVWDIRNFVCVQTFGTTENRSSDLHTELTCFFHTKLPLLPGQTEVDSRIFAASKWLYSFDQMRVVHELTTDKYAVLWTSFIEESWLIMTASAKNLTVWDALLGSKTIINENICGEELTACCMDDRRRKIVIGDILGRIKVYNPINGTPMKSCAGDLKCAVQSLAYVDESRKFIAGYVNGHIRIYDESHLDDCMLLRAFDVLNIHSNLTSMSYSVCDKTVASASSSEHTVKFWDFDTGKCDLELDVCSTTESIVQILYLSPYPLLLTSDSLGNVTIWGSSGCRWKGSRLSGFLNQTPQSAEYEPRTKFSMTLNLNPNSSSGNGMEDTPRRILPPIPPEAADDDLSTTTPGTAVSSSVKSVSALMGRCDSVDQAQALHTLFSLHTETIEPSVLEESLRETSDATHKWGPVAAALAVTWDSENNHIYTGDEQGNIRKWDISDVIDDLGGLTMLQSKRGIPKDVFKITRHKYRNYRSAMVPANPPETTYVLGHRSRDSYLGVEFCWTLAAHKQSIVHCNWTRYGLLTSCTARLLKMWTGDGRPIGILMQGVPIGMRSQMWNLELNIDSIVKNENEELNKTMDKVIEISKDSNLPDIRHHFSSSSLESSAEIAKLSTSSLRKRIEKSGRILGLIFENDNDNGRDRNNSFAEPDVSNCNNIAVDETSTTRDSIISKSAKIALDEANAAETENMVYENDKPLTEAQQKRKNRIMNTIVDTYERQQNNNSNNNNHSATATDLPTLRMITSGVTVDVNAIEGLSNSMYLEDVSLGRRRGPKLSTPTRPYSNNQNSPSQHQHSPNKRSPHLHNSLTTTTISSSNSPDKRSTQRSNSVKFSAKERLDPVRTACSKYSSYHKLEECLSMNIRGPLSPAEKELKARKMSTLSPLLSPLLTSNKFKNTSGASLGTALSSSVQGAEVASESEADVDAPTTTFDDNPSFGEESTTHHPAAISEAEVEGDPSPAV
eukprot:gene978-1912_t